MLWAKQSTAKSIIVGPILDSTGAEYASAVIGDLSLSKNGGTLTALASAATLTYIANGYYTLALTTGNMDTLGTAEISCNKSTYQMPPRELMVMPATVYDAMVTNAAGGANGFLLSDANNRVDIAKWLGTAVATPNKAGVPLTDTRWVEAGTAQGGTSSSITLAAGASSVSNYFNGWRIKLTGGTGAGQARIASAYNGTTKVLTVSAWSGDTPDNTTEYIIEPAYVDLRTFLGQALASGVAGKLDVNVTHWGATAIASANVLIDGAITAAKIASDAFSAAKFADGCLTAAKFASGAFDAVWTVTTRLLTAGTNIVLSKGVGLLGLNDLSASDVNAEVDTALADYAPAQAGAAMTLTSGERTAIANEVETQIIDDTDSEKVLQAIVDKIAAANPDLGDLTLAAIASAVRTELATELARIDAAISTRLATGGYTVPPTAVQVRQEMDSNSTKLVNLDAAVSTRAATGDAMTLTGAYDAAKTAASPTQVETSAGAALAAYDPPTRAEATSDKDEVLAAVDGIDGGGGGGGGGGDCPTVDEIGADLESRFSGRALIVPSPVSGNAIRLVAGSTYGAETAYLEITKPSGATWPDLSNGEYDDIRFSARIGGETFLVGTGSVVTPTGSSAKVRFAFNAEETDQLRDADGENDVCDIWAYKDSTPFNLLHRELIVIDTSSAESGT